MPNPRLFRLPAALLVGLALVFLPAVAPAVADEAPAASGERVPILWEVQTEPTIYLFGTMHVADVRVTTHPPVVQKALDASQALYTELDFANMGGADLLKHVMIPDGKSLADIAGEETMAKLEKVIARYEIPAIQAMQFQRLRPWLTAVQLPVLVNAKRKAQEAAKAAAEAAEEGASPEGAEAGAPAPAPAGPGAGQALDLMLYANAKAAGKTVGGLEKPVEQFSIFNELTLAKQVKMLDEALDMIVGHGSEGAEGAAGEGDGEAAVDPIEKLIRMYLVGDVDAFHDMMVETMGEDEETKLFMEKLLDRRNVVMVRRMLEAAERHPDKPMFVAVGAGHYPGPLGIVSLLRKTGFRVRRLTSVAAMDAPWPAMGATETSSRAAPAGRGCCPPRCCPPRPVAAPGY